ncbi:uncharacterized protein LOC113239151 isoform X1 [Hyposmocoma kahamanoa]|uniref:uncharacterized protein LOC113239151 isoform X1 n=1 Tax=Hyposmocoma kahamanoa TaxID=1477025 RepID=UPI000E6D92F6|nr:uncharacterized protein LOC113239151 isoform X1 [Hyposmocoma kahamanoa]XP_026331804.1 uncharacterized protein LOC113239151 isoform X1 [Hyposmocoma kahamanoa]XP_026331805.1 uncharacterized protein LOC113239151 isoform X1 [Hyposmocoma kahamanoa]
MFKIESYVTPILLSYVDKYVRDFKPADAQVSLWAGGVALHNLILKPDVLQQEVSLPFTLISGRIHELLIQVPWTKIMSEPITVAIDTIECILSFRPPATDEASTAENVNRTTQVVEAPPGYMQALVRRIVSNITVKVHHLIVKYVQDDIVLSLNVKHLTVESAGADWTPAFADIDQNQPVIRRIVTLDDLTLCLDQSDDDGKIRFYQEPLLYRCQLSLKVLTKLVTIPLRRAQSINMQLSSSKLAWGITNEQLALILTLVKEHERFMSDKQPTVFNKASMATGSLSQISTATSTELRRETSWSEWAWSWMPSWGGDNTMGESPRQMASHHATKVFLSAYLDEICLTFKIMETEIGGRKRPRGVLDVCADYLAFKSYIKKPVLIRAKFGIRNLTVKSQGKCVCGHLNTNTLNGMPTVYLSRKRSDFDPEKNWHWPKDDLEDDKIDTENKPRLEKRDIRRKSSLQGEAKTTTSSTHTESEQNEIKKERVELAESVDMNDPETYKLAANKGMSDIEVHLEDSNLKVNAVTTASLPEVPVSSEKLVGDEKELPDLWHVMNPLFLVEFSHERSPPLYQMNPFENPPSNFEYSDWEEECAVKVVIKPLDIRLCMDVIHRLVVVKGIFDKELSPAAGDPPVRTLTVEECDALHENLPQRRINIDISDFRLRIMPWDHLVTEKQLKLPILLDLVVPKATCAINGPLYAHRVCSAACQMPEDSGPLWLGARLHITITCSAVQVQICPVHEEQPKPCARLDLRCVMHALLYPEYFVERQSVTFSYSAQIRELNISGSAARLQASLQILLSLLKQKGSLYLRQTTLAKDALNDEGEVVLDVTFEEIVVRGYFTKFISTQVLTLQALRSTVIHGQERESKQAWVISGPDHLTTTPFLRTAFQWAVQPMVTSLDYVGIWLEPLALSMDPLFVQWLAYRPILKPQTDLSQQFTYTKTISSPSYLMSRRRITPPSSSGRGGSRTGSGQEQVHMRGRSMDSSSEPSEKKEAPKRNSKDKPPPAKLPWWRDEHIFALHSRLKHLLISVETGIIQLYVTTTSVPAENCPTVLMAMEQHASEDQQVLVFCLGRWTLHTNSTTRYLWQEIKHDGPTFIDPKSTDDESFPWKMSIADMSCYTFVSNLNLAGVKKTPGLRSRLKVTRTVQPVSIVDHFTTTVTFSVLTKSLQYVVHNPKNRGTSTNAEPPKGEAVLKYFSTGMDFKPKSFVEFMRGPTSRKKEESEPETQKLKETKKSPIHREQIIMGPMIQIGFHWHADTPPIMIRLDQEQLNIFSTSVHCIQHFVALLKVAPLRMSRHPGFSYVGIPSSRDVLVSGLDVNELDLLSESEEETKSDLVSIFESRHEISDAPLKTFVWFQWVISRLTMAVTSCQEKITVNIDDIISTIDLQEHYNQFRMKIEHLSVLYHQRNENDEWVAGPLNGRVIEVREPAKAQEVSHFLALTITQASLSNIPPSWKEELHPKLLDTKINPDLMWEIYANIMPIEVIIQPSVFEHFLRMLRLFTIHASCTVSPETRKKPMIMWPFVYITAGGVRVIITEEKESSDKDDAFVINVGKIVVNPHPDNPICRKSINATMESAWTPVTDGVEGRQYEMQIKSVTINSGVFQRIIVAEDSEHLSRHPTTGQNPARKWSQQLGEGPILTSILHSISISCVAAPPLYIGLAMQCGAGLEINLTSDALVDINLDQIALLHKICKDMKYYYELRLRSEYYENELEVCPYMEQLKPRVPANISPVSSQPYLAEGVTKGQELGRNLDSGLESGSRSSVTAASSILKNPNMSVGFVESGSDSLEYLELFITVGSIEMSLYARDVQSTTSPKPRLNKFPDDGDESDSSAHQFATLGTKRTAGTASLLNVTFNQPNLYYWRKRSVKNIQISLFNLGVGLGSGFTRSDWKAVLVSTARGVSDPMTEIPPALFTLKIMTTAGTFQTSTLNSRGSLTIDVERPILLEICEKRLARIKDIHDCIASIYSESTRDIKVPNEPLLYKIRQLLQRLGVDSTTIQTTQIGVQTLEGTIGFDSLSVQLGWNTRPEQLIIRSLITAFMIACGPANDSRRQIIQPFHAGFLLEAMWEVWRRIEGRMSARDPSVRVCIDLDKIIVDLRPADVEAIANVRQILKVVFEDADVSNSDSCDTCECVNQERILDECAMNEEQRLLMAFDEFGEYNIGSDRGGNHFYKDDLRSGAFKIINGSQLPMAYQVTLNRSIVSWRYPHPRAIIRLIAFPLPGIYKETDCVLELFNRQSKEWKPHTFIKIPVSEPREVHLFVPSPDAVFCTTWRFRVYSQSEIPPNYEFNISNYEPRPDALVPDPVPDTVLESSFVTAEMLSGVLRVDSYFSPRLLPRIRVTMRLSSMLVHAHNSLPTFDRNATHLEGYYVTKPLMRSHRVLTICSQGSEANFYFGSPAGSSFLLSSKISSNILDCTTGILVPLVDSFNAQAAVSLPSGQSPMRLRICSTNIHVGLHVPRVRTLCMMAEDWQKVIAKLAPTESSSEIITVGNPLNEKAYVWDETIKALEGRVSLWIDNSCTYSVRIGQEGTDEVVPMGPGAKLAYRWRSPTAPKRLRFALTNPSTDWRWSHYVRFTAGSRRVRLEGADNLDASVATPGSGVFLYVKIAQQGATRQMLLTGRLLLANVLRFNLLFKVRAHFTDVNQWRTVASGELATESIGRSVICAANCELVLKIRLKNHETGWSGDIPLKECPKENVPWLVKVPSDGDVPYISVWCRVNRARSDGRILASIWPLYVLRSHLPLDTDILIATEMDAQISQASELRPPPLIQSGPGRGTFTHLMAPGTTSARHILSFQYRNIECPVTREAVPLHYGVTDNSVFDKRAPVNNVEEVIEEIRSWLRRAGRDSESEWPYSIVKGHWPGPWQPTFLQPRCEVAVRYQAVRAGGGCSLEVQMSPVLLLCNASPITLTLRAHDAAPLCKLEPGSVICPPSAMLKKPFFMSVEVGRETFVSRQLKVSSKDPGRYGTPPPGEVALEHAITFAVQCNQKVALLTMHYEIKEEINVVGITATYMLVNRLKVNIMVSATAVVKEQALDDRKNEFIRRAALGLKTFKLVPPTPEGTILGASISRLWLQDRWRGHDVSELQMYLYVALANSAEDGSAQPAPVGAPVPVRLGAAPLRRPIALHTTSGATMPVVVTQQKHDGRWLITVANDPCPQFALYNNTSTSIAVAQPVQVGEEASTSAVNVVPDCDGERWLCSINPNTLTHYSTPSHCARHPPSSETTCNLPFLTFARIYNEDVYTGWCPPVAVTEGEQLVQLNHRMTIKLRVRVNPHSTYIELREVDDNDISASDIRRRLGEPQNPEPSHVSSERNENASRTELKEGQSDDTDADEQDSFIKKPTILEDIDRSSAVPAVSTAPIADHVTATAPMVYYGSETMDGRQIEVERVRILITGVVIDLAVTDDSHPLLAVHLDRLAALLTTQTKKINSTISIGDIQVDNLQYDSGQYDFAVIATTRDVRLDPEAWPPIMNMFNERSAFAMKLDSARFILKICNDEWSVGTLRYNEITEIDLQGPSWERDCVRWTFRMADLVVHAGFEVLIDDAQFQLLITPKYIVVAEGDTERIIEMIDLRYCTLSPYEGPVIELHVKQRRAHKVSAEVRPNDDDDYQVTAAAMARVARYTGAETAATTSGVSAEHRMLTLLPNPGQSYSLHCTLAAAIHSNSDTHFCLL